MPTDTETDVLAILKQLTDRQLTWLLMRELYRMYDSGGISSRCERSLVLEAGLAVCGKAADMPSDLQISREEARIEVVNRTQDTCQLGFWQELGSLTTDDFLALVARRVHDLFLALPESSSIEGEWLRLLTGLTQADRRALPSFSSEDIIREGRSRSFFTAENVKGLESSSY